MEQVSEHFGQYGILWGIDGDNYYAFMIKPNGQFRLRKQVNNKWIRDPIPWTETSATVKGKESNRLKLIVIGESITLVVNDKVLKTIEGRNFGPGKIGLAVGSLERPEVKVSFDNLMIYDQLLFRDDFSDPGSGWDTTSNNNFEKDYRDGKYSFFIKEPNWLYWSWAPVYSNPSNFESEVHLAFEIE